MDQGPTETTLYGEKVAVAAGPTDDPVVLMDDPALHRLGGNPEYWARVLPGVKVWTDWAARRGVTTADARRIVAAQAEAQAVRAAEEAAYQAFVDQKRAERQAKREKEAAERRAETERQLARARTVAQEQAARDREQLAAAQAEEKARRDVPPTFAEWKAGKR